MFQGFLFVLLFIQASNKFFSQSVDASETNSVNGILALFLSGDIQTNPGPRHQPEYPVVFESSLTRGHPMKKLYSVMNAAYGTIGHVLKCAPKNIACYNAQSYSGCAVGAKHLN